MIAKIPSLSRFMPISWPTVEAAIRVAKHKGIKRVWRRRDLNNVFEPVAS